ncbi:hypothetical protein [Formosa haliotis]|uniref:hypothetical protein n=1 Tax=Formosa haliotis TaxID=1555194 RepID=UPI000824A809|nr:hypothetical protein [Formosa haliotis]
MKYLIIFFLFISTVSAQEKVQSRQFDKVTNMTVTESTVIYDYDTGKLIDISDISNFGKLLKKYPKADLMVKDTDLNGYPTTYYFIKDASLAHDKKENLNVVKIKQKDITNSIFDLSNIDTKYTLIILQHELEFPRINVESISEVENAALDKGFTSLILTESIYNQAKTFASSEGLKSIIIPNASALIRSFDTNRYPFFVLLNADKAIVFSCVRDYEIIDKLLTLE